MAREKDSFCGGISLALRLCSGYQKLSDRSTILQPAESVRFPVGFLKLQTRGIASIADEKESVA